MKESCNSKTIAIDALEALIESLNSELNKEQTESNQKVKDLMFEIVFKKKKILKEMNAKDYYINRLEKKKGL